MKMIRNIYEGGAISEEARADIYTQVNAKEEVITVVDDLLQSY